MAKRVEDTPCIHQFTDAEGTWKNLICFFITPKVKSKQLQQRLWLIWCRLLTCVLEVSEINYVLGNGMLSASTKVLKRCLVLYVCNLSEESVMGSNKYLVIMLLVASKKTITKNWGKVTPLAKKTMANNCWRTRLNVNTYTFLETTRSTTDRKIGEMDSKWWHWNGGVNKSIYETV